MKVFQITQFDIDHTTTLTQDELGKWAFIIQGTFSPFYNTQAQALAAFDAVFS